MQEKKPDQELCEAIRLNKTDNELVEIFKRNKNKFDYEGAFIGAVQNKNEAFLVYMIQNLDKINFLSFEYIIRSSSKIADKEYDYGFELKIIRLLINKQEDIQDSWSKALNLAVSLGNVFLTRKFLEMGAKVNNQTLTKAVYTSQLKPRELFTIIFKAGANPFLDEGFTPEKYIAATVGNEMPEEEMELTGRKHLLLLGIICKNLKLVEFALRFYGKAIVNSYYDSDTGIKKAAIHYACEMKLTNIVEAIVKHGGDIDAKTKGEDEFTPLDLAIEINSYELVDCLLNLGADPNIPSSTFPLVKAAILPHRQNIVKRMIDSYKYINLLATEHISEMGVDISMLEFITQYGQFESFEYLLNSQYRNTVFNYLNSSSGNTIMHCAAMGGSGIGVIKALYNAGFDINVRNKLEVTPLQIVCLSSEGSIEKVQYLLELGANPYLKDIGQNNALDYTLKGSNANKQAIENILRRWMATHSEASYGGKQAVDSSLSASTSSDGSPKNSPKKPDRVAPEKIGAIYYPTQSMREYHTNLARKNVEISEAKSNHRKAKNRRCTIM